MTVASAIEGSRRADLPGSGLWRPLAFIEAFSVDRVVKFDGRNANKNDGSLARSGECRNPRADVYYLFGIEDDQQPIG